MTRISLIRTLTVAGALVSAISLAGTTLAVTLPSHASSTAVTQSANASDADGETADTPTQDAHASAVSTAANSDTIGGAHQNHGGYVSCVARGGSDCTSTTPTLPSHGTTPTLPTQAQNGNVPAR